MAQGVIKGVAPLTPNDPLPNDVHEVHQGEVNVLPAEDIEVIGVQLRVGGGKEIFQGIESVLHEKIGVVHIDETRI